MIPLYAFVEGDTLGLLVLAREAETVAQLADRLQKTASLRVAPRAGLRLRHQGRWLEPSRLMGQCGVQALDRIDLAIGTKFPSYFVRHPHKVAWLIHQYRAGYELAGTVYSDFHHVEGDVGLRDRLIALDREMLGECRRLFANARNTAGRLARYNGLQAEALYHPPRLAGQIRPGAVLGL